MDETVPGPHREVPRGKTVLHPGLRIAQYELISELGRGGMGVVYAARDLKLNRKVAMKFLRDATRDVADRFLIEARATARCSHDNIVIIHEVDEFEGMPYMVLEHLEGTELRKLMADQRLPPARVVELALPIARALSRAHELGIIHRDLKPENVFVMASGQVKVLDFGIAKAIGATDPTRTPPLGTLADKLMLTGEGALIGTLPYIAPEQMTGDVDYRVDLWALGVILFELLAGEHPVTPLTRDAVYQNLFDPTPMRALRTVAPEVPEPIAALVSACLEKSKQRRIASANAVVARLEELLPEKRATARRGSRRRAAVIVAAGLVAALVAGTAVWLAKRGRTAEPDSQVATMYQLAQRGEHQKASLLVDQYLAQHPDDPDVLALKVLTTWWGVGAVPEVDHQKLRPAPRALAHALALMSKREEQQAIAYLEDADRQLPQAVEIVYGLGEAYWHGGRLERGVAMLERAFQIDPRWQMALHHVFEYRLARGETAALRPIAETLRATDRPAAAALECRLAIAERRYADAARETAAAIDLPRAEPIADTYACLVQAHVLAGDLDSAERVAKTATERAFDLREWGGLALEGELMLYRGKLDDYLELTRGKPSVQRSLAISLWRPSVELVKGMRDVGLSVAGMRQAPLAMASWILTEQLSDRDRSDVYSDWPELEVSAFGRGVRAERRGDFAAAIAEFKKVIATPAKGDIRMLASHHLARVLQATGDAKSAAAACVDVLAPRVYQGYRALLVPDCRLWSGDPAEWRRLAETWQGFDHPSVVEARRRSN